MMTNVCYQSNQVQKSTYRSMLIQLYLTVFLRLMDQERDSQKLSSHPLRAVLHMIGDRFCSCVNTKNCVGSLEHEHVREFYKIKYLQTI